MTFKLRCEVTGCTFEASNDDKDLMLESYRSHQRNHASATSTSRADMSRAAKAERPKISAGCLEEVWNTFLTRWNNYKRTAAIPDSLAAGELFECCEKELGDDVIKQNSSLLEGSETALLDAIKQLAVIPVAICVRRAEVLNMKQDHGEGMRPFYARVKGKADTCKYVVICPQGCNQGVDYTPEMIKDVLLSGISDLEIKQEVLGWTDLDTKTISQTVTYVESKEMARNALLHDNNSTSTNAINSSYRKMQKGYIPNEDKSKKTGKCPSCGREYNLYKFFQSSKRYNAKPFPTCFNCKAPYKKSDEKRTDAEAGALFSSLGAISNDANSPPSDTEPNEISLEHSDVIKPITDTNDDTINPPIISKGEENNISVVFDDTTELSSDTTLLEITPLQEITPEKKVVHKQYLSNLTTTVSTVGVITRVVLTNKIFDSEYGWQTAKKQYHPRLQLRLTTSEEDYRVLDVRFPRIPVIKINVITDSGAQSCLWGIKPFLMCGFLLTDLVKVDHKMCAANKVPINIIGAIIIRLDGRSKFGVVYECAVMVFVTADTEDFFLSKEAMQQLAIIPKDFPSIGAADNNYNTDTSVAPLETPKDLLNNNYNTSINVSPLKTPNISSNSEAPATVKQQTTHTPGQCSCPKRVPPPGKPSKLPFEPIEENNKRFRNWCLETYAASTFNQCTHTPLPKLVGPDMPPLAIHVDQDAKPVAHHKPGFIPLHQYDAVIDGLKTDIALNVLEYAPLNEPVTWCHKMVIATKSDGSPRRCVDMAALNKNCKREPHIGKNPFQSARAIPRNVWKSVQDAWNGFHGMPIRLKDRHLTTFQTPIGRLRYMRAPQGALCSGDGYNRRFDMILMDFSDHERCIDDTVYWDVDLRSHWWRCIEFLEICGKNGVVLNPSKFQCALKTVIFAGFQVTATTVEPHPKYLDAIRLFPTPKNITDVRAWVGLINHVAHYAQLRDLMAPLRPLMKKDAKFIWTPELDEIFESSKEKIVEAIRKGVEIFEKNRITCLSTDWSKSGIGYYLSQKHCKCDSTTPGCCKNGSRITLAGSRHLKPAESRYAPVEGEALAIVWSLKQTKYFTLGCNQLTIITDHKPLIKLFGDRTLDEIQNMRLFKLKEKSMHWMFKIVHRPGKLNFVADATSRNPTGDCIHDEEDDLLESEVAMISSLSHELKKFRAVTWERIKEEMQKDDEMRVLLQLVMQGIPENKKEIPPSLEKYHKYKESIYELDGVLMCKDRILVPPRLREEALDALHSAHHGVESMGIHSQSRIIWPGISQDTENARKHCRSCNRNAPSNPRHSPEEPRIPTMPFECLCSDFFQLVGYNYLVAVDRFSGWAEVFRAIVGTASSGSQGLIAALRELFGRFGVPLEISSDGASEYTSDETKKFFQRWGVKHQPSSAYHPSSNGRAELGVKSIKRLLMDNVGPSGSLNTDQVLRALLTHRNTPDALSRKSPSEVIFGHKLRDALPVFKGKSDVFKDDQVLPLWREGWAMKEQALRTRAVKSVERLSEHSKELVPLQQGDRVFVQNQAGNHPKKWDRSGTIMECRPHHQYTVKVDATGRVTLRNRQFLRKFNPAKEGVLSGIPSPFPTSVQQESKPINDVTTTLPDSNNTTDLSNDATTTVPAPETIYEELPTPVSVQRCDAEPTLKLRQSSRIKNTIQRYDAALGE